MRISIVGDFCPIGRFSPEPLNSPDDGIFAALFPYIHNSQLNIANLECPVVDDTYKKIDKQGPSLKCSIEDVRYLQNSGINLVTLANNHIKDYGEKGIEKTINCVNDIGLDYVGAGCNLNDAARIFYKKVKNKTVAIINCCEHEFSIATDYSFGANPLDAVGQWTQIQEAKSKANYVVVIIHGGSEHYSLPTPRMKQLYRFFVDSGADAVINHHQHCCSGYEIYKEKPIFYGLGNFCFDYPGHSDEKWHLGVLVSLDLEDNIGFETVPFYQFYKEAKIELLNDKEMDKFSQFIKQTNSIIADDLKLNSCFRRLCKDKARGMLLNLMPYSNKYFKFLAYKEWLPSFIKKKRILSIYDVVNCESHRDILIDVLNMEIYGKS